MFITKIITEEWTENKNDIRINIPDIDLIENEIKKLDGKVKTMLTLETDGNENLIIGGGPDYFIVTGTLDNEEYILINDKSEEEFIELNAGGQYSEFPLNQCQKISNVLIAAKTFAIDGVFDKSLIWRKA